MKRTACFALALAGGILIGRLSAPAIRVGWSQSAAAMPMDWFYLISGLLAGISVSMIAMLSTNAGGASSTVWLNTSIFICRAYPKTRFSNISAHVR